LEILTDIFHFLKC